MSLIPGTLPSDSCFGTPQELLELFSQFLDVPAFVVSSRVLYSDSSPLPSTDFLWIDTTGSVNNVLKVYNTVANNYQEYPFSGTVSAPNTLIDGKTVAPTLPLNSTDNVLVSQGGVLHKVTMTQFSTSIPNNSISFSQLTTQNKLRAAKAWVNFDGNSVTSPASTTGIRSSFNVSSILDNGAGDYTINFSVGALADANYAVALSASTLLATTRGAKILATTTDNGAAVLMTNLSIRVGIGTSDASVFSAIIFGN